MVNLNIRNPGSTLVLPYDAYFKNKERYIAMKFGTNLQNILLILDIFFVLFSYIGTTTSLRGTESVKNQNFAQI